jgi:regulatory protein
MASHRSSRFSDGPTKGKGRPGGRAAPAPLSTAQAVYDYAVGRLARSAQTAAALRRALRRRVEPGTAGEALIEEALQRLVDHGYLSDERYARDYAGARMTQARLGSRRIANELQRKGVPAELAQAQVRAAFAETDELTQARAFLAKKRVQPPAPGPDNQREAARIFRMLARAGFAPGTAVAALRSLRAGLDVNIDLADEPEPASD